VSGEQLLDNMAYMAALPVGNCLENMDMDGIRHKDLLDFKGYCFHSITSYRDYPVPVTGEVYRNGLPYTGKLYDMK
jgi:hypothetical protein